MFEVKCERYLFGRYVVVIHRNNNYFHMDSVQVYPEAEGYCDVIPFHFTIKKKSGHLCSYN